MDIERATEFLRTHHRTVLHTRRRDGSPQLSPVVCAVNASGRVVVSTRETALKTRNVLRDPRVSLCVFSDGFFGEWIQVDGTAEVITLPTAMDMLVDYYRTLSGEHPDWDEYRRAMETERRAILAVTIERAGPDQSG